jgi:restriction system protein
MAEITTRRRGEIQRNVTKVLIDSVDPMPAHTVIQQLESQMVLTDFEKSEYPSYPGVPRFRKVVRFMTITLVKAGWIIKSKGRWSVTDDGKRAYKQFPDPETFAREARKLYVQWKADQPDEEQPPESEAAETRSTLEEAEENAWTEIQDYLSKTSPYDFQNLVAALLKAMDYHVSWVSPPGKDAGIDILAHNDPLGTRPPRIKVQVKRRADKVGVDGLRSFLAVLGDDDVGIFVSLGGFTPDAENEARTQERRRVTLLDLERLFDLWVEHYDEVEETEKKLLPLRPIYFLDAEG